MTPLLPLWFLETTYVSLSFVLILNGSVAAGKTLSIHLPPYLPTLRVPLTYPHHTHRHLLLADFRRQSIPERLKTIAKARPGGSITPCIKNKLRHLLEKNKETMTLMEGVEVKVGR